MYWRNNKPQQPPTHASLRSVCGHGKQNGGLQIGQSYVLSNSKRYCLKTYLEALEGRENLHKS